MSHQRPPELVSVPTGSALRVHPSRRLECLTPNLAIFLSEHGDVVLEGNLVYEFLQRIDGTRAIEDLVGMLATRFPPSKVANAAERLAQRKFIEASNRFGQPLPEPHSAWLQTVAPPTETKWAPSVNSVCLGSVPSEEIEREITRCGVKMADNAPCALVWCDDYLDSDLQEFNRLQLQKGHSWMLAKPVGSVVWLGPVFRPATACWECLARRLRANQLIRQFLARRCPSKTPFLPPQPFSEQSCRIAVRLALGELASLVPTDSGRASCVLCSIDLTAFTARRHPLLPWPGCPACGRKRARTENAPLALQSDAPNWSASEIDERRRRLVDPITGVVSFVRPAVRDARSRIWLSVAANPAARVFEDWSRMKKSLTLCCAGAATTRRRAETAAFCEAVERYSGIFQGCEPRRIATMKELGQAALHPNKCLLFSREQYRRRVWWNSREASFNWIPIPFRDNATIEWTPLWSLTHLRTRYLPTGMCYYHYPADNNPFCRADSNGCAVGRTLERALVHGFLELVERDAVAIWWYNRIARPAIDLQDDRFGFAASTAALFQSRGWRLCCLDLTHDFGIPVAAAVLLRLRGGFLRVAAGFAARFSLRQAVNRAVCELSQFVGAFAAETPPSPGVFDLAPEDGLFLTSAEARQSSEKRISPANLEMCLEICRRHGLEMLALNLTRPDSAMPAVKVVTPGLRPFWPRFGRGRLFQTPVEMGWLSRPRREEELNPIHLNM